MSKAYNGSTHDKKIADEDNLIFPEEGNLQLFQDTGYQGYSPENVVVIMPTKKPKGVELTEEQREENRRISSARVIVEHAIGSVKVLRIIKDQIRIYKETVRNLVMKIACAIHNLKIKIT